MSGTSMIPVVDPFMQGHEPPTRRPGDFLRDRQGTPYVSDPTGKLVKRKRKNDPDRVAMMKVSRPSNFGKIIEDMYSVTKWSERQEAFGFALAPELADRAKVLIDIEDRESQAWKDEADKIVKAAKLAAKADLAADRGTHTHGLAEDDDEDRDIITRLEAGKELGLGEDVQRSLVACWRDMLERDGLEILAVEMPVVNDIYRAAGTLDRVAKLTRALRFRLLTGEIVELPAGTVVILDIKTGKRRLRDNGTVMYWHSYAVQVFLYGPTSRPYDTDTDTRGDWQWEINGQWALIAHLDVLGAIDGNPSCDLILVDLEAGRRAADLCVAAKAWSNEATVFSVAQIVEGERVASTRDGAPGDCPVDPLPSTLSVNDLIPRQGLPQHALDEIEVDRLNDQRRQSYEDWSPKSSAGMPDPSAPLTVGEEAGAAAGHSPASSTCVIDGVIHGTAHGNVTVEQLMVTTATTWPLASPDRLALVDARAQLRATPDEGADLAGDEFAPLWDRLRKEFDALPAPAKTWRSELAQRAKQRGVSFMAQEGKTERRYNINRGLIALAIVDADDEILRAILALVLGDIAWFVGIEPGHLVGSLNHVEAAKFADLCDTYISPPPAA